jgi:hypothetical protein
VTREIGEPLRRLALLVKAKGGRDSVICVDPALNTRAPSEELDDGCWIGYCEQLVVGLVKAGDERLNRFCVEARILWELDFNVPGLLSAVRLTPDELDTQIKQPTPRASVDEGGPNRRGKARGYRFGIATRRGRSAPQLRLKGSLTVEASSASFMWPASPGPRTNLSRVSNVRKVH